MSDSDDTDILLLIPPNFFLTESHLNESPNYEMFRSSLEQPGRRASLSPRRCDKSANQSHSLVLSQSKDLFTTPPQLKYRPYNEASPTMNISNFHRSSERLNCMGMNELATGRYEVVDRHMPNRRSSSPIARANTSINKEFQGESVGHLSSKKMSEWKWSDEPRNHDELISLTNVWNNNLDFKSTVNHSTELEEEKLRRRQCERNISLLQSQLNQYQNKFSDVIKIDQAKNDTLAKLHDTNSRWACVITSILCWRFVDIMKLIVPNHL